MSGIQPHQCEPMASASPRVGVDLELRRWLTNARKDRSPPCRRRDCRMIGQFSCHWLAHCGFLCSRVHFVSYSSSIHSLHFQSTVVVPLTGVLNPIDRDCISRLLFVILIVCLCSFMIYVVISNVLFDLATFRAVIVSSRRSRATFLAPLSLNG